jgi:class 3 adenylate cyclase
MVSSVDIIPGIDWGDRFEHVLARSATVTVLNEYGNANDGAAFDYCNQALNGLAMLKGKFFGVDVVPVAVWDGKPGDGRGGTHTFVEYWKQRYPNPHIIRLDEVMAGLPPEVVTQASPVAQKAPDASAAPEAKEIPQEVKAMLFADIVGFTKLTEIQIPLFVDHFMGKVADLMTSMQRPPIHKNTWGDAVCCVFDQVADAGVFALNLRDLVRGTNWHQWGLPNELNIRIALHAGPVYACWDPVLGKMTYNGSHVNRTARIEPVAEEGQIYASQAFAALATAEDVAEFVCDYVGTKQLAKKFGAIPVFLVRRTG